jgi:hypothetical protein
MLTFEELNLQHCRWPVADSETGQPLFCGKRAADGFPYCAEHALRAYCKPMTPLLRRLAAVVAEDKMRKIATGASGT